MKEPSVSYRLANEISARTGQEIRVTIPGHFQRGGSPCAYDRMLTTRFGTAAAELIANKKFGCMVALQNNRIVPVPLEEVAGKLKTVSLDCDEIVLHALWALAWTGRIIFLQNLPQTSEKLRRLLFLLLFFVETARSVW